MADSDAPVLEREEQAQPDGPSAESGGRKRKSERHRVSAERVQECAKEIRTFLRSGAAGTYKLASVYAGIRKYYLDDDEDAWEEACLQAFQGYAPCPRLPVISA